MKKQLRSLVFLMSIVILVTGCSNNLPKSQDDVEVQQTILKQGIPVYYDAKSDLISPQQIWETFKKEYGLAGEMKSGGAGVLWNKETGIPRYVVGFRSRRYDGSPQKIATAFLQDHGNLISLKNDSLYFKEIYESGKENQVIYEQRYESIIVYGTQVSVLVTPDGRIRQLNADYYPDIKIAESKTINTDAVRFKTAVHNFLLNNSFKEGPELDRIIESRIPERFIYPLGKGEDLKFYSTLLYRLPEIRLFLDANSAEVISAEKYLSDEISD